MENGAEQNKTEEPSAFKLKRSRERGMVARGIDLGFFSALSGLALFAIVAGDASIAHLQLAMQRALTLTPDLARDHEAALNVVSQLASPALYAVGGLAATAFLVAIVFELVQVRGIVFSAQPLKPDFSRLNPGKGLKRIFSMRMLLETLKSIVKLVAYALAAWLTLKYVFDAYARSIDSAHRLAEVMHVASLRLLFSFLLVAFFIAVIDQIMARREFLKQMRMSRSELTREHKEREGEPRLKQKRKQLHAEFASQTRSLSSLAGSDMLIVNPQHYAVALRYDATRMDAPEVTAKGRNLFALQLKRKATSLSIAIFEQPPLARALYRACDKGAQVPAAQYAEVAALYLKVIAARRQKDADADSV